MFKPLSAAIVALSLVAVAQPASAQMNPFKAKLEMLKAAQAKIQAEAQARQAQMQAEAQARQAEFQAQQAKMQAEIKAAQAKIQAEIQAAEKAAGL